MKKSSIGGTHLTCVLTFTPIWSDIEINALEIYNLLWNVKHIK
jgi:hypothetical protein